MQTEVPSGGSTLFYRVGLSCEAAPEIGCGIRAKPVLKTLERSERVAGAWLSRSGAYLAVQWRSSADESARLIASAFAAEECACIEKVSGADERRALNESLAAGGWHSAVDIDRLSVEEAAIIAERVVRRTAAKAPLHPQTAARLAKSIAQACERLLTSEDPGTAESRDQRLRTAILDAGRPQLGDELYGVLDEIVTASGHRPLPNER